MAGKQSTNSAKSPRAFTLIELLVVLAVVAMLACLCLPALARVRGQSTQAQCAANLRQFTLSTLDYSTDHVGMLPGPLAVTEYWAWDMPRQPADLLDAYGAHRAQMYCPANPEQNTDRLWNYDFFTRLIGYAVTLEGTPTVYPEDINTNTTSLTLVSSGSDPSFGPAGTVTRIIPSRRVLYADVVVSANGQNNPSLVSTYQWSGFPNGVSYSRTSHFAEQLPAGGNVAMLDGHVEWRAFTNMLPRTTSPQAVSKIFWW